MNEYILFPLLQSDVFLVATLWKNDEKYRRKAVSGIPR